jgi:Sec-independent protein translocase protein TatA
MTKFLVITFLIIVLFGLVALRFRKQIQTALYVLKMFRQMRKVNQPEPENVIEKTEKADGQLVRCVRCGTWVPETKAMSLGPKMFYCSTNCIESAVSK